jgi:hypothetical protein
VAFLGAGAALIVLAGGLDQELVHSYAVSVFRAFSVRSPAVPAARIATDNAVSCS